jgi:uncharacterized protein (DUF302 family)
MLKVIAQLCPPENRWALSLPSLSQQRGAAERIRLIALKSPYGAKETMSRLEDLVKQRGLTVFARMDHAAGAAGTGKTLRPAEVIIFGNPQGGTPLIEWAQTAGIDLPLKALVWQDANSQVWLGCNDPEYLGKRHEASQCAVIARLREALAGIAGAVVARQR